MSLSFYAPYSGRLCDFSNYIPRSSVTMIGLRHSSDNFRGCQAYG